jgi:hypothetical protein
MAKPKTKTILVRRVDVSLWGRLREYARGVGRYTYRCLNEALQEYLSKRESK